MKTRIIAEEVPNPQMRVYHTTVELSQTTHERFDRTLPDYQISDFEKIGEHGEKLVRELVAIPGVTEVGISPYEVSVQKGDAFEWEDIHDRVIAGLKKVFQSRDLPADDVEVTTKYEPEKWRMSGPSIFDREGPLVGDPPGEGFVEEENFGDGGDDSPIFTEETEE